MTLAIFWHFLSRLGNAAPSFRAQTRALPFRNDRLKEQARVLRAAAGIPFDQGDQMRLWKIAQNVAQQMFFLKI
jgi:hypothetical protein